MSTAAGKPAEPNQVKDAATGPRLVGLALTCIVCVVLFGFRERCTWPEPLPRDAPAEAKELRKVPDARCLGYTPTKLRDYFAAIGPKGRALYAWTQPTLDLLFPLAYGSLFVGLLARIFPHRTRWVWVPGYMAVADLCENAVLTVLALTFCQPDTLVWTAAAWIAAFFTLLKWLLGALGCLVGLVAVGYRIRD